LQSISFKVRAAMAASKPPCASQALSKRLRIAGVHT
jgi:hypothetical protein